METGGGMAASADGSDIGRVVGPALDRLAELRTSLMRLEDDLGLAPLSRSERDLLYAAREVAGSEGHLTSADLRAHRLVSELPPASFHRALRALLDHGHLKLAESSRARHYILVAKG